MVDFIANAHLGTLYNLLVDEVRFIFGVSDEVKKAEEDLRTIHARLMDADQNKGRSDSESLKDWMKNFTELVYRSENVLEKYAFEVEFKKECQSLKKKLQRLMCILCECYTVHEIRSEIDHIRSRLTELKENFPSGEAVSSNSARQEQIHQLITQFSYEEDRDFVGMEKEIELVVSLVKDDSPHSPSVISICGMGGLGKTTLARKIYNDGDVRRCFDRRAWVCVTQQFQAETILREIFEQIDSNNPNKEKTYNGLVRGLNDVLVQKKCLIVIDDIWEVDHWEILKKAFPRENCKVVLTTRFEKIASLDKCRLRKLSFSSEDEGWELLKKKAFSHGEGLLPQPR